MAAIRKSRSPPKPRMGRRKKTRRTKRSRKTRKSFLGTTIAKKLFDIAYNKLDKHVKKHR